MNIRPGTRLQIGPHVIEVRTILECSALTDAVCVEVESTAGVICTIFIFRSGKIMGKRVFGSEMVPVEEISAPLPPAPHGTHGTRS